MAFFAGALGSIGGQAQGRTDAYKDHVKQAADAQAQAIQQQQFGQQMDVQNRQAQAQALQAQAALSLRTKAEQDAADAKREAQELKNKENGVGVKIPENLLHPTNGGKPFTLQQQAQNELRLADFLDTQHASVPAQQHRANAQVLAQAGSQQANTGVRQQVADQQVPLAQMRIAAQQQETQERIQAAEAAASIRAANAQADFFSRRQEIEGYDDRRDTRKDAKQNAATGASLPLPIQSILSQVSTGQTNAEGARTYIMGNPQFSDADKATALRQLSSGKVKLPRVDGAATRLSQQQANGQFALIARNQAFKSLSPRLQAMVQQQMVTEKFDLPTLLRALPNVPSTQLSDSDKDALRAALGAQEQQ